MKIFLVGYMGSGKSTIGKKIALSVKAGFIDTDQVLEQRLGMSVHSIFEKNGEEWFRIEEQNLLKELTKSPESYIISTGGGMPCYKNNMDLMNSSGTTIFLDLPVGMLISRLKSSKQQRPLLKDKNLDEFVTEHLNERKQFYNKAHITIDSQWLGRHSVTELLAMIDQLK